jgi:hypothetical protein
MEYAAMAKRPGSLRPVQKKPTFVVSKKGDPAHERAFVPPVENVPAAVEEHKKVVYCNALDCVFNQPVEDLVHTEQVVRKGNNKNSEWKPLTPQMEKVWKTVCTRSEVVIDMKTIVGAGGSKRRVPGCHTPWETGRSGHVDMSKRMGESWSIDDNRDSKAMDEGQALMENPFYGAGPQ